MRDLKKICCIRRREVKKSYGLMKKLVSVLGLLAMSANAGVWEQGCFGSVERQLVLSCAAVNVQGQVALSGPDATTVTLRFLFIVLNLLVVISLSVLLNSLVADLLFKLRVLFNLGNAFSIQMTVGNFVGCAAIALVGVVSAVVSQWFLGGTLHFLNSFSIALAMARSFLLTAFVFACPLHYIKILTVGIAAVYLFTVAASVLPIAFDCNVFSEIHSRCGVIGASLQQFTLHSTFLAFTGVLPLVLYVLLFYKAVRSRIPGSEASETGSWSKLIIFLMFLFVPFLLFVYTGAVDADPDISVFPSKALWLHVMNNINTFNLCYVLDAAFLVRNRVIVVSWWWTRS